MVSLLRGRPHDRGPRPSVPTASQIALGLTVLATAAVVAVAPISTPAPPAPGSTTNAATSRAEQVHTAEADVIRERRGHDGTPIVEEEWHDPGLPPAAAGEEPLVSAAALDAATAQAGADTFALHSRPGAARTIFLDFDGGTLLSTNSWLLNGLSSLLFPGWSTDASAGFSASELAIIEEVWARVAEDYAPFDIDVTTQEPPAGGLWRSGSSDTVYGTRVAFSSGSTVQSGVCSGPCGGIAWVGVFDSISSGETRSPAWVFPSSLGNRAKTMADAAAHEAGHTLGLSHDGTSSSGYYSGNQLWGPIMGSPYNAAVTQWSKGDYPGANNREDDVAEIVAGGAPLRPDEAGSTPSTAWPITSLPGQQGFLSTSSDVDWYSVSECSGTVTARVDAAAVGPNADLRLEVRDGAGNLLAAAAPATGRSSSGAPTGMGASVDVALTGGPYYLAVSADGSGTSWASGGYDSYGSIGSYHVYAGGCAGAPPPPISIDGGTGGGGAGVTPPSRPATPKVGGTRNRKVVVKWRAPSNAGGGRITGYLVVAKKLDARGRTVATRTTAVSPGSRKATLKLRSGRWSIVVRAGNEAGWSTPSKRSVVRAR